MIPSLHVATKGVLDGGYFLSLFGTWLSIIIYCIEFQTATAEPTFRVIALGKVANVFQFMSYVQNKICTGYVTFGSKDNPTPLSKEMQTL